MLVMMLKKLARVMLCYEAESLLWAPDVSGRGRRGEAIYFKALL